MCACERGYKRSYIDTSLMLFLLTELSGGPDVASGPPFKNRGSKHSFITKRVIIIHFCPFAIYIFVIEDAEI